jgi:hypothetical protein
VPSAARFKQHLERVVIKRQPIEIYPINEAEATADEADQGTARWHSVNEESPFAITLPWTMTDTRMAKGIIHSPSSTQAANTRPRAASSAPSANSRYARTPLADAPRGLRSAHVRQPQERRPLLVIDGDSFAHRAATRCRVARNTVTRRRVRAAPSVCMGGAVARLACGREDRRNLRLRSRR